jgi:hypothetical protein
MVKNIVTIPQKWEKHFERVNCKGRWFLRK